MNLTEKATIIHYHRHRIEAYCKGTVQALGWREEDSQIKRFEVLATIGDLNGRSLLDVGCGYGDLKAFFDQRFSEFAYIGIDQMPEFVADARDRYKDCDYTFFYQTDFATVAFPEVDYVFASGALGYRCEDSRFYFDMIEKMYESAKIAVAFNMLDARKFPQHPLLVGHNPDEVVSFCKGLSPRVEVITGYLEDDFTIFMYKDGTAPESTSA